MTIGDAIESKAMPAMRGSASKRRSTMPSADGFNQLIAATKGSHPPLERLSQIGNCAEVL
jgi:hypothetical protein